MPISGMPTSATGLSVVANSEERPRKRPVVIEALLSVVQRPYQES